MRLYFRTQVASTTTTSSGKSARETFLKDLLVHKLFQLLVVGVLEILPVVDQLIFCQRVSVRVNSEDLAIFEVDVEVGFSLAMQVKQVVVLVTFDVLVQLSSVSICSSSSYQIWCWLQVDLS